VAAPLIQAIDRAIGLCTQTLNYARDEGPELTLARFRLRELLDEVVSDLAVLEPDAGAVSCAGSRVINEVSADVIIEADRDQVYRVFANLGRNAFEAGARQVTLRVVETLDPGISIDAADDGPGLARAAREGRPVQTLQGVGTQGRHRAWPCHRTGCHACPWGRAHSRILRR